MCINLSVVISSLESLQFISSAIFGILFFFAVHLVSDAFSKQHSTNSTSLEKEMFPLTKQTFTPLSVSYTILSRRSSRVLTFLSVLYTSAKSPSRTKYN